jgi:hypothetical protein
MRNEKTTCLPVTQKDRPDLDWSLRPRMSWVGHELLCSPAYLSLTKIGTDVLMFALSMRRYPPGTKKKPRDYWKPTNSHEILIPYKRVREFFSTNGNRPPTERSVTRAINDLMAKGFIDAVRVGGSGKGDVSKYRLTHDWRVWAPGDPPIYTKEGMSHCRGFCRHPEVA